MSQINRDNLLKWVSTTKFKQELAEYVQMKSRSNQENEVRVCAEYSKKLLESAGLTVELYETIGNPVVFGERIVDQEDRVPTLLLYGHYDVQPEGDISKWHTPPFELVEKNGKYFGRGTADNKGQHYAHILALRYLQEFHPDIYNEVNVKFILDGDEERGSFSLPNFFEQAKDKLEADFTYLSDGPALRSDMPTLLGSVRGILSFQMCISHNKEDLHSGNFGGLARSATSDLISLLNAMIDPNGKCLVPGFYDDVVRPSVEELGYLDKMDFVFKDLDRFKSLTPAKTQNGLTRAFQNQFWPTININGFDAGSVGKNRRTIIPQQAQVSIDCRLVPNQDSEKIKNKIIIFLKKWAVSNNCSDSLSFEFEHAMEPVKSSLVSQYRIIIEEALQLGFNQKPLKVPRLGGSLPTYLFDRYLRQDIFLVPYALPDENNHAPNENLDIDYFQSGVAATAFLIQILAKFKRD